MSEIYNRIKILCDKKQISIAEMCRQSGVAQSTITELKKGRTKTLSNNNILKIANFFDVSADILIGNKKTPTDRQISVDERVDQIIEGISDSDSGMLMLNGEPASPEALESLRASLKVAIDTARRINKMKLEQERNNN